MTEMLETFLGQGGKTFEINAFQMGLRSLIVYGIAILFVRMGSKRMMGHQTPFDFVVGIMLGSILSRAITGQVPMVPAITSVALLIAMHWVVGAIAGHVRIFGWIVKGKPRRLILNGKIDWKAMRRSHISLTDIEETLRREGRSTDPKQIRLACLERSGDISIVPKREPRIIDLEVKN